MKTKIILLTVVLLGSGTVNADIVTLDLFTLGCQQEYNMQNQSWETDFDLGMEFFDISAVYIDWSGEITAGLVEWDYYPGEYIPEDVGIYASLGYDNGLRLGEIFGGRSTYPAPEPFDEVTELDLTGSASWSDLLDGTGRIILRHQGYILLNGHYVDGGNINLGKAMLMVEGTIIPEPTSLCFILIGLIGIYRRKKQIRN